MQLPRRHQTGSNCSQKPSSKSAKPPTLRRPQRPRSCSRIRPPPRGRSRRTGANHEPPDAVSQTLSVADSRHRDAYWTSNFASGGVVLVGDAAAPELLPDYLSRQHRTREPARRDDQGRMAAEDGAGTETGGGFGGRCRLSDHRQWQRIARQTFVPRRRRRLARSGQERAAASRVREAGAVSGSRDL